MTSILGISAFYHDSAACILEDGKIIAAAQEERFTRKKHDASFPIKSINLCLKEAKISHSEIDYVVFYDKPFLKFERLLETYMAFAPKGFKSFSLSMPIWLREKLFQKKFLFDQLKRNDQSFNEIEKISFSEHHFSHAASAFYPPPFKDAIILTADGVGEWATTTLAIGKKNNLDINYKCASPENFKTETKFDVILNMEIVEHVEDLDFFLEFLGARIWIFCVTVVIEDLSAG